MWTHPHYNEHLGFRTWNTVSNKKIDCRVVCVITGGNIDYFTLPRSLERAKAIEGRIIKVTVRMIYLYTYAYLRELAGYVGREETSYQSTKVSVHLSTDYHASCGHKRTAEYFECDRQRGVQHTPELHRWSLDLWRWPTNSLRMIERLIHFYIS